ncbi:MAG: hypothetical protein IJL53_09655 [Firmicutes bacterium]|nr:hypothetical protein [Bacillota bacterium]
MKKLSIICIAVILLLISVLNGCSGKAEDNEAEQSSDKAPEQTSEAEKDGEKEADNLFDYAFAVEENALVSKTVAFGTSSEDALEQLGLTEEAMLNDTTFGIRRITRTIERDDYMNGMTEIYNFLGNSMNSAAYVIAVAPDKLESLTVELAGLFGEKMPAEWTSSDTTKYSRRYSWKDPAGTKLDILVSKNPNADGMNEINISLTLDAAK